jgi:predicted MFS family arabinose efflux permease
LTRDQAFRTVDASGGEGIGRRLLALMAVGSGLTVANLYYIQPLLPDVGRTFSVSASAMGLVFMVAQLGFATGVLFFVPLGDSGDRRRLILVMLVCASLALEGVALASSLPAVAIGMFCVGAFSVTPQMFVPFAAHLASADRRGRALGVVMSGLLLGILTSRTISGFVGAAFGWRAMFHAACGLTLALAAVMAATLPRTAGSSRLAYGRLIGSLWHFTTSEPVLRESSLAGAMFFGSFSAFWSMLAFRLELPPLHYGSRVAGLFSLVGVVGAGAAPVAGRLADRLNPRLNVQIALALTACAFVVFGLAGGTVTGLLVGVIVLDAAVQAGHVLNLSRVHSLTAEARNRVTTVYMVTFFLGGAVGSALAASAWQRWQWTGVCGVGLLLPVAALVQMRYASSRAARGPSASGLY